MTSHLSTGSRIADEVMKRDRRLQKPQLIVAADRPGIEDRFFLNGSGCKGDGEDNYSDLYFSHCIG
jgi:hypothetical protein